MSSEESVTKSKYRVVAMIPTEIYVDAVDEHEAQGSLEWLFEQYPEVDAPVSDTTDNRSAMMPRIMTVESA